MCLLVCVPTGLSTLSDIIRSLREDGLTGLLMVRTLSTEAPAHRPRLHPQPLTHSGFPEILRASGLADRSDAGEAHGKGSGNRKTMRCTLAREEPAYRDRKGQSSAQQGSPVTGPGLLLPR